MLPDVDDLNTYGGAIADYSPVVDPTTDEGAIFRNFYAQNVAGMTHTLGRVFFSFVTANGANPTDPGVGHIHDAVWGAAPGYKPAIVRFGEGVWDATLPATVQHSLLFTQPAAVGGGRTHTVNVRRAFAQVENVDGVLAHATAERTGANTVRIRTFLANGTADDIPGKVVTVWVF